MYRKDIDLHIFNNNIVIEGGFFYKNGATKNFGDNNTSDFSDLRIHLDPPNVKYMSKTGTIALSEVDFTNSVGKNEAYAGLAAYKIIFNGSFVNFTDGEEVNIKGTVKVNFPTDVEQY